MMRASAARAAWAWAVTATLAVAPGCGDEGPPGVGVETFPASGRVLRGDGSPLPGGVVTFVPADPNAPKASSPIASDGRFSLNTEGVAPGAPAGDYKVRVELDPEGGATPPGGRRGLPFPAKFARESASGLTATVRSGSPNEFSFTLK